MKIIKRSGAEMVFDITKIIAAITKANNSVGESERLTASQIHEAAANVEKTCLEMNRAPSVEEIQDLVENQIMHFGAFSVARKYITYRYVRAMVRQSNTTDEQILSLIECNNEEVKQENFRMYASTTFTPKARRHTLIRNSAVSSSIRLSS